jgi:hypothetical protein
LACATSAHEAGRCCGRCHRRRQKSSLGTERPALRVGSCGALPVNCSSPGSRQMPGAIDPVDMPSARPPGSGTQRFAARTRKRARDSTGNKSDNIVVRSPRGRHPRA